MTALTVPDLLLSLAAEMARLAVATERLHDLVEAGSGQAVDAEFMRRAQDIDHTTQVMGELAEFCANLAADAPAATIEAGPALSLLRLTDLRARLASGTDRSPFQQPSDGALELF